MKVITPPQVEPVSIAEVKEQIGIADTIGDALIARRIVHARTKSEGYTDRAFITQTREIRWDCFRAKHELPSALTIVSVKYIDPDGAEQTLGAPNYALDAYPFVPVLKAAYGVSWPSTRAEENAVRVQFTAGYGPRSTDVPAPIKEAMILFVGHLMNHQKQSESGILISRIPYAVRDMLDDYKINFL